MANDILVSDSRFKPFYKNGKIDQLIADDSNLSVDVQVHYSDNNNGMAHVLYPEPGVISKLMFSSWFLTLNNTFDYYIIIGDPKFRLITSRPGSIPTTFIPLEKGTGMNILFMKVVSP